LFIAILNYILNYMHSAHICPERRVSCFMIFMKQIVRVVKIVSENKKNVDSHV